MAFLFKFAATRGGRLQQKVRREAAKQVFLFQSVPASSSFSAFSVTEKMLAADYVARVQWAALRK